MVFQIMEDCKSGRLEREREREREKEDCRSGAMAVEFKNGFKILLFPPQTRGTPLLCFAFLIIVWSFIAMLHFA